MKNYVKTYLKSHYSDFQYDSNKNKKYFYYRDFNKKKYYTFFVNE